MMNMRQVFATGVACSRSLAGSCCLQADGLLVAAGDDLSLGDDRHLPALAGQRLGAGQLVVSSRIGLGEHELPLIALYEELVSGEDQAALAKALVRPDFISAL